VNVSLVVVLGESVLVQGYALAGATTLLAETPEEVRRAWEGLDGDVSLVVLTPRAAVTLGPEVLARTREPLTVEMTS
jgi:vacuolar-type H+-ATPase subunit F/Vma7